MTKEQRAAMARVISDMIKADNIIEESEIKDMKKLMSEYPIIPLNYSAKNKPERDSNVYILCLNKTRAYVREHLILEVVNTRKYLS